MSDLSSIGRSLPPVALVLMVGLVYATGRARLAADSLGPSNAESPSHLERQQFEQSSSVPRPGRRGLWFHLGLAVLLVGLSPPLDDFTHRSLGAHMSQHVILMVIAPLFLVLADPWNALVAGLPERIRTIGLRTGQAPAADQVARSDTPGWTRVAIAATVVQSVVMWAWHLPTLYDLAVRTDGIHALEHLMFLGSGVWFWWAVGATGSRRNGMAAVVVFIAALPGTALGAALMLASHPWFPAYPDMQDQQVAGAIMWSIGGAVYLAGAVVLFISWLSRLEIDTANGPTGEAGGGTMPPIPTLTPRST